MSLSGNQVRVAVGYSGQDWGTAETLGANTEVKALSIGDNPNFGEPNVEEAVGQTHPQNVWIGETAAQEDPIEAYVRYNGGGLDAVIAQGFGAVDSWTQQASTTAYKGTFYHDVSEGTYLTYAVKKAMVSGTKYQEFPSCKVTGLEFTYEKNAPVTVSATVVKDRMVVTSPVNDGTAWGSITLPDEAGRVLSNQSVLRIKKYSGDNDATGSALDSADEWGWATITVSLTKTYNTGQFDDSSDGYIGEPFFDGLSEITLSAEFQNMPYARFTELEDTISESNTAIVYYKGDLKSTGANIAGSYNNEFNLYLPKLKMQSIESSTEGPGGVAGTMTFMALGAGVAPTGFTRTEPIYGEYQSERTSDPLA